MKSDPISDRQNSLFSLPEEEVIFYEQPLNERIRAFLRLEYLFDLVAHSINGVSAWESRMAMAGLIEINDLLSRFDLRAELIKETERHSQVLTGLRQHPNVDAKRLQLTLNKLNQLLTTLRSDQCQPAQLLRKDELVYSVRQRLPIPGGACNFDLPGYHFWLSRPAEARVAQLHNWLRDLAVIRDAVAEALSLIRESAHPLFVVAPSGFYQQPVDPTVICQLVRVGVAIGANVFPEISGGKHRFTIRFLAQPNTAVRPVQSADDIEFELQCCNL
ncbi:MAG: cell division protein ZapD [Chromatiales bacterium]